MKTLSAVAVALGALLVACGTDGPGTGPVTTQSAEPICNDICARDIACDASATQTLEQCTAGCVADITGWVRQDAAEVLVDCASQLACGVSDDACLDMVEPLAIHQQWATLCSEKLGTCDVNADLCLADGGLQIFAPIVVGEMIDCLAEADCNARLSCLQTVFTKYHVEA